MARPESVAPRATAASPAPLAPRGPTWLRLNPFRRQPPVFSPLPRAAIAAAAREAGSEDTDIHARLENLLRHEYAAERVILCGSGTMALQLAIQAAIGQVTTAKPVALPAFTCYDVATAAVGADARIALYDIDPDTLQPDLDSLESVLREGAGVVVIAHLFGFPVEWDEIERLAAAHGAVAIEDAAQGHGGRRSGRRLGGLGPMSILSFGRGKGWTGGGGGALLLRSDTATIDLQVSPNAHAVRDATMWFRVSAQSVLGRPALYGLPASIPLLGLGETRYHGPATPTGMGRFTAALLMNSRAAAEREASSRRHNGHALDAALSTLRDVLPVRTTGVGARPGFLRFPARITGGGARLEADSRLARLGVVPSYPQPLSALPAVANRMVAPPRRLAGAEALVHELVTLPTHSLLSDRGIQQVLQLLDIGRRVHDDPKRQQFE